MVENENLRAFIFDPNLSAQNVGRIPISSQDRIKELWILLKGDLSITITLKLDEYYIAAVEFF
jgi:hypothetical protein